MTIAAVALGVALVALPQWALADGEEPSSEEFETVRRLEVRVRAALATKTDAPSEEMVVLPGRRHVLRGTVGDGGEPAAECLTSGVAGDAGGSE